MGFLTDPQNAQYVDPGQVGQVARGYYHPAAGPDDRMAVPIPAPPQHLADTAAGVVGQYIQDHGNLLRQRLMMGHMMGGFAPAPAPLNTNIPGLVSQLHIPQRTLDPTWSNQAALQARFQGILGNLRRAMTAHTYYGRH